MKVEKSTSDSSSDQHKNVAELSHLLRQQEQKIDDLTRQLEWFKRQMFGRKSEKRLIESPNQMELKALFPAPEENPEKEVIVTTIAKHQRRKNKLPGTPEDSGLRFDEAQVPVQEIAVSVAELEGENSDQYEIIRYENTYRLAQQIGSYVILKYVRPVIKNKNSQVLKTTPAPANVFDKSLADVSFVAGMLIDKFVYHLPLYRQHQRLKNAHIELSRATLTNVAERAARLLEPIANEVLKSILLSRILAMDETTIKAGRKKERHAKRGQMKTGYFWPLFGDRNELYFSFASTRATSHIETLLNGFTGTLLTDGYAAYEKYCAGIKGLTHAQCWAHTRRYFEKALDDEPELANRGLDYIAALYSHEKVINDKRMDGQRKLTYRGEHCKRVVDAFYRWCLDNVKRPDLIATESPVLVAINYALKRKAANHVERALRVIPMGRNYGHTCIM